MSRRSVVAVARLGSAAAQERSMAAQSVPQRRAPCGSARQSAQVLVVLVVAIRRLQETAVLVDSQPTQRSPTRLQSQLDRLAGAVLELVERRWLALSARLSLAGSAVVEDQAVERRRHLQRLPSPAMATMAEAQVAPRVPSGSAQRQRQPPAQLVMAALESMPQVVAAVARWHSQHQRLRTTPPQF